MCMVCRTKQEWLTGVDCLFRLVDLRLWGAEEERGGMEGWRNTRRAAQRYELLVKLFWGSSQDFQELGNDSAQLGI